MITRIEKDYQYSKLANEVIEYIEGCADKNIVPLKHDVNIFRTRKLQIDKRRLR